MSATPREKERRRKKKRGEAAGCEDEQRESDERGSTGWEPAPSWRRSPGSRCKLTGTQAKCQFLQQTVHGDREGEKPEEMKRASPSVAPSSFIYKVFSFALMNETKDYAQLRGSPGRRRLLLLVSSCSADLRSILPWGITLDHLWDAKQERTSRWGRRGLRVEQERPHNPTHPPPQHS